MTYLKRTKLVYAMYAGKIGSGSVVLFEFWFSEEEFRYWVHTVIVSLISIKSEVLKSKLSIADFSLEKVFFFKFSVKVILIGYYCIFSRYFLSGSPGAVPSSLSVIKTRQGLFTIYQRARDLRKLAGNFNFETVDRITAFFCF